MKKENIKILVTGSGWVNGSGWSYTEDLDPITVNTLDNIQAVCNDYARDYKDGIVNCDDCDDYEIRFYISNVEGEYELENPVAKSWVNEQ